MKTDSHSFNLLRHTLTPAQVCEETFFLELVDELVTFGYHQSDCNTNHEIPVCSKTCCWYCNDNSFIELLQIQSKVFIHVRLHRINIQLINTS